nr:serine protease inhibitor [Meretrix meretrix]
MKVLIVACFLALVAAVCAENCEHTSDCTLVACNAGFNLRCYGNVCTCVADYHTFNCTQAAQCEGAFSRCTHGDHHWHCVDNRCMCRTPDDRD